jgi:hypothetical protein
MQMFEFATWGNEPHTAQLHALRIGQALSAPSRRTKDVLLLTEKQEWTCETKGKTMPELFAQIDTLAKVRGWSNEDKALIVKTKLHGLALQFFFPLKCLSDNLSHFYFAVDPP